MAKKKKGFYINKVSLEKRLSDYCEIIGTEVKNQKNQQTRYTLEKDEVTFYIDVYFRADNTITINPIGNGDSIQLSNEIYGIIRDSDEYKDVTNGTFSTEMSYEVFEQLLDFLKQLPGVTQGRCEDKGNNGIITKFTTDFGDSTTLTYYRSTSKMFYQGRVMNLYPIIKTFIAPLVRETSGTTLDFGGSRQETGSTVEEYISENLPHGYSFLDPIMAGFVRDTFTLVVASPQLNDYASWLMGIMRVLEHRIKDICHSNDLIIDDEKGFSYFLDTGKTKMLFSPDNNGGHVVNKELKSKLDTDTCDLLERCYKHLKENRHEVFHVKQITSGTVLIPTSELAIATITETCELIEESLVYNKVA